MADMKDLIRSLGQLDTEKVNRDTVNIDRLPALEIVRAINREDRKVAEVVALAQERIARAAETFAATLRSGGRIFYVGAGTSGRLGVLDAAECPPTFGTEPEKIVGLISGGYGTLVLSLEGVEDDREAAVADLKERELSENDFVIGLAASRRTPYTLAAIEYAKSVGCRTAFIVCNNGAEVESEPDILIELPVGPEVITGSTRMKSGTAQKMTLNMISTTAMVLMGKTYGNLMIDLQARSEKLAARSRWMLMEVLKIDLPDAEELLERANGSVKLALAMAMLKANAEQAAARLEEAGGFLSRLSD